MKQGILSTRNCEPITPRPNDSALAPLALGSILAVPPPSADKEKEIPISSPSLAAFSSSVALTPFTDGLMFQAILQYTHVRADALALTQVNQQGYALRFYSPHLQVLHFKTAGQVAQFMDYCQEAVDIITQQRHIRKPEAFSPVHSLLLTFSDALTVEQCVPLFHHLPSVHHLQIHLTMGQDVASLGPVLKAAQACRLTHLSIEQTTKIDAPEKKDGLPAELWGMRYLESLNLQGLINVRKIEEEIGQLAALTHVEFKGLEEITVLPASLWGLSRLEKLVLIDLPLLEEIPENIGQLTRLKSLTIARVGVEALPESICHLNMLRELELGEVVLPEEINKLTGLISLRLNAICGLLPLSNPNVHSQHPDRVPAAFPQQLWQLSNLQSLVLSHQSNIFEISEKISQLQALTSLSLIKMPIQALPEGVGRLLQLKALTLHSLSKLVSIPKNIVTLPALTSLELVWLKKIQQLPQELGGNKKLARLVMVGLEALLTLPDTLGNLPALRIFALATTQIETLLTNFPALEMLILGNLKKLSILPEALANVSTLKQIKLYGMPYITVPPALMSLVDISTETQSFWVD
jgi:Leucine-rich repeat (LRR) protein